MINLTIKYFGMLSEATGTPTEAIEVESKTTLNQLVSDLKSKYPGLNRLQFRTVYNKQFIANDCELSPKSEIAFLPPFAGG